MRGEDGANRALQGLDVAPAGELRVARGVKVRLELGEGCRLAAHPHRSQIHNRIPNELSRPMIRDQATPLRQMIVCPDARESLPDLLLAELPSPNSGRRIGIILAAVPASTFGVDGLVLEEQENLGLAAQRVETLLQCQAKCVGDMVRDE